MKRTQLANERTYLAWLRTGLGTLAIAFAVGKLVPELLGADRWPYVVIGAGFAVLGVGLIAFGAYRLRAVERALRRGEFSPLDARIAAGFALAAATLGGVAVLVALLHE